ncbi:MAG: chorismate synthase [Lachnospiraceae bacterium]|nr:chorismate synthase [Lachnospiraceae bacterium]
MSGSTYGTIFKITTWGESHGKGIGVVVDGCPAGLALSEEDIQVYLNRRRPGHSKFATPRKESDAVSILSGVFEGKTTGTPISLIVHNEEQRSRDYSEIASYYRPGHADLTFDMKYGFRDYRGGGRSSGRETIGRVAAGAIAAKILKQLGVELFAYTKSIGPVQINPASFSLEECLENPVCMPDKEAAQKAEEYLSQCMARHDSAGGCVECVVKGIPAGIGEPVFDKLDACLAKGILSIGAVKAFEIGDGIEAAQTVGSINNDAYQYDSDGKLQKLTNHAGGILGGISDGSEILLRAYFKPTPSISTPQKTVNQSGENIEVSIKGRHDPIIVPRAVVVVEAMTALTILDLLLMGMSSRMEYLKDIYLK